MGNRTRRSQVHLYLSEKEHEFVYQRMARCEVTNFSRYAREMLLRGYIIHQDHAPLHEVAKSMGSIARSMNQIAKLCNETHSVHASEVAALKEQVLDLRRAVSERLVKLGGD